MATRVIAKKAPPPPPEPKKKHVDDDELEDDEGDEEPTGVDGVREALEYANDWIGVAYERLADLEEQ